MTMTPMRVITLNYIQPHKYLLGMLKVQAHFCKYKGVKIKIKHQAGAELCQAQDKLILFWPWLDPCLDPLRIWLMNLTRLESKVWSVQFGKAVSLISGRSHQRKEEVQKDCFGWSKFWVKKFWVQKIFCSKKNWGSKIFAPTKIGSKKHLGLKIYLSSFKENFWLKKLCS